MCYMAQVFVADFFCAIFYKCSLVSQFIRGFLFSSRMTITIEIEPGIDAVVKSKLQQAFAVLGMSRQGDPTVLGGHVFEYYTLYKPAAMQEVLVTLRAMNGIAAAYAQPDTGLPLLFPVKPDSGHSVI